MTITWRERLEPLRHAVRWTLPSTPTDWAIIVLVTTGAIALLGASSAVQGITRGATPPPLDTLYVHTPPPPPPPPTSDPQPGAFERVEGVLLINQRAERITIYRITPRALELLNIPPPLIGPTLTTPDPRRPQSEPAIMLTKAASDRWFTDPKEAIGKRAIVDGGSIRILAITSPIPGGAFIGADAFMLLEEPPPPSATLIAPNARGDAWLPLLDAVIGPNIKTARAATHITALLLAAAALAAALAIAAIRAESRQHEIAFRIAIGVPPSALAFEASAHALRLTTAAVAIAALIAWWIVDAASAALVGTIPGADAIALDAASLPLLAAYAAASIIAITLPTIARLARTNPAACIRPATIRRAARPARTPALIQTSFTALILALLAALATAATAAAITTTAIAARAVAAPTGFSERGINAAIVDLPAWRLLDPEELWAPLRDAATAIADHQRVRSVAIIDNAPALGPDFNLIDIQPVNTDDPGGNQAIRARLHIATRNTIELLEISVLAGTIDATVSTDFSDPMPAIISESLARSLFDTPEDAVNRAIALAAGTLPARIVAVVADIAAGPSPLDTPAAGIWLPMPAAWTDTSAVVLVKADNDQPPRGLVRDTIIAAIPDAAVTDLRSLTRLRAERARVYIAFAAITIATASILTMIAATAAIARTRLRLIAHLDQLRLCAAFGTNTTSLAIRNAIPQIAIATTGALAALLAAGFAHDTLPAAIPTQIFSAATVSTAAAITIASTTLAAIAAALTSPIDPAALLRPHH